VLPAEQAAKGYNGLALQHSAENNLGIHKDLHKFLYDKGKGTAAKKEEVGSVLYNRGMLSAMFTVESIRVAQGKFGKRVLTGEEVQWGAENLNIDGARIKALGVDGMLQPIKTSCRDHEGARRARVHTWDGSKWSYTSDWYEADAKLLRPMIETAAKKYGGEKKIEARSC
jgi:branched-chain amino acid transport system substrate-binding protein